LARRRRCRRACCSAELDTQDGIVGSSWCGRRRRANELLEPDVEDDDDDDESDELELELLELELLLNAAAEAVAELKLKGIGSGAPSTGIMLVVVRLGVAERSRCEPALLLFVKELLREGVVAESDEEVSETDGSCQMSRGGC